MQTGKCPACGSDVLANEDAYEGDLINCANCETELEVISLHPLQFSATAEEMAEEE